MNPGVAASWQSAATFLLQGFATLCRDAATVQGFKARVLRRILSPISPSVRPVAPPRAGQFRRLLIPWVAADMNTSTTSVFAHISKGWIALVCSAGLVGFATGAFPAKTFASEPASPDTPRFTIAWRDSGWWLVSPEGEPFFSKGVCLVAQGASREEYDPENPGYAAWQHYPSPHHWADATLRRLKAWRFTTAGAWSDFATLRQSGEQTLWLTPVLHIGSTAGAPWWDMWDAAILERMDQVAREQILPLRDDPRVLGYYSDNELGWWNAALWKMTLEQAPTSGQRQRLIQLLRDTYQNDWSKLREHFEPEKANDWTSLEQGGMLYVRPGTDGFKVMRRFLGLMAERYYQLVHDLIRKYDRRALILGDRYQSFYYPEVARASARWVDASSSNLNASWSDGTYLRCYLDTLHRLTGKPILISEFYSAARENRSGNRNSSGVFPVAATQAERARALRTTLARLAGTPYVLGADWFQYFDEPRHGRDDGENFNFGLVDIHDRPYDPVTAAFAGFDGTSAKSRPIRARVDASAGVPPAPRDPFAEFVPMRALQHWDRERGFVPCASAEPLADLYMCWSPKAIYLGLYALDITENAFYRGQSVPKADRAQWVLQVPGREPLRIRLGSGREPLLNDPAVRVEHLSGVNLTVRSITALELTAAQLGRKRFRAGDRLRLDACFTTHGQCYRMVWAGDFVLAK